MLAPFSVLPLIREGTDVRVSVCLHNVLGERHCQYNLQLTIPLFNGLAIIELLEEI